MSLHYTLKFVYLIAVILSTCSACNAERTDNNTPNKTAKMTKTSAAKEMVSHHGKHFVLGFLNPSTSVRTPAQFEIFITTLKNNTKIRVHIPHTFFNKKYVLRETKVLKIEVPNQLLMARQTKLEMKGLEISSTKEIKVYAFHKVNTSHATQGDGFQIFPRKSLGLEYVVTSYGGSHSNLGIVAAHNNTNVTIVMNENARVVHGNRVYRSGDELRFTLNKLQTFHLESADDLSGVRVVAKKPVAVFSGASCELSNIGSNCGYIVDQLPATRTWGQKYIVFSRHSTSTQGGLLRITSATENTEVFAENGMRTRLGIGGVMDLVVKPRVPTLISCTPHCMPTLYRTDFSSKTCSGRGRCNVGPLMSTIPATTEFLSYYSFYIPRDKRGSKFLTVVIKCSSFGGLIMNGAPLANLTWKTSMCKTWCGSTVEVLKHGVNTISHRDRRTRFGVMVTGIGGFYSYSYFGGRNSEVVRNKQATVQEKKPTINVDSREIGQPNSMLRNQTRTYKITMVTLSVLCGALLLLLVVLFLRLRTKQVQNDTEKDISTPPKQAESNYQSIRGFPSLRRLPRRDTHSYETVKLPLKMDSHPAITDVFSPSETGQQYENLKPRDRESNPYVPMDQALVDSAIAGSAIVLSMSGDNDLYLTMKRLIREPPETEEEN